MSSEWFKLSVINNWQASIKRCLGPAEPTTRGSVSQTPSISAVRVPIASRIVFQVFHVGNSQPTTDRETWGHHLRHCHVKGGNRHSAHSTLPAPSTATRKSISPRLRLTRATEWSRADARSRDAPAGAAIRRIHILPVRQFTVSPRCSGTSRPSAHSVLRWW